MLIYMPSITSLTMLQTQNTSDDINAPSEVFLSQLMVLSSDLLHHDLLAVNNVETLGQLAKITLHVYTIQGVDA